MECLQSHACQEPMLGLMYIHLNSQCLQTFDRENNYGPGRNLHSVHPPPLRLSAGG